ncbi:MAG: hypothetical protein JJT90_15760 [Ectothiorhodospiraceae bacterium]|nr:hypothetical protein [Ectothiorhodospiraceae bacterium]
MNGNAGTTAPAEAGAWLARWRWLGLAGAFALLLAVAGQWWPQGGTGAEVTATPPPSPATATSTGLPERRSAVSPQPATAPAEQPPVLSGGGEGLRSASPSAGFDPQDRRHADSLFALRWAAAQGLSHDALDRLLDEVHPAALAAFFETTTHIDRTWLWENGLDETALRQLFRLYAGQGVTPGTEDAPAPVGLSPVSVNQSQAWVYTDTFPDNESTVFLHYQVPADYAADGVVIRWLDADNRSLVHVDRHSLNATPHERQEAWIRRPEGWAPGRYRIEIFALDATLTPIAATDYRVFRYGEE